MMPDFIISGWNLSWGEGQVASCLRQTRIISGWNLSWGEGAVCICSGNGVNYIRLESELG